MTTEQTQYTPVEGLRLEILAKKLFVPLPTDKGFRLYSTKEFKDIYLSLSPSELRSKIRENDPSVSEEYLFRRLHGSAYHARNALKSNGNGNGQFEQFARRYLDTREILVEKNLGLAHMLIRRAHNRLDLDDLESEAVFALGRAVDRFNFWKGYKFSTYACNVIFRSINKRGKKEAHYKQVFPVYYDPTMEEYTPKDHIQDETSQLLERLKGTIANNKAQLTEIECAIITRRFPQGDGTDKQTFQEIGAYVGLSKERVRQIQQVALQKLRDYMLDPFSKIGITDDQSNLPISIPDNAPTREPIHYKPRIQTSSNIIPSNSSSTYQLPPSLIGILTEHEAREQELLSRLVGQPKLRNFKKS